MRTSCGHGFLHPDQLSDDGETWSLEVTESYKHEMNAARWRPSTTRCFEEILYGNNSQPFALIFAN